MSEQEHRLREIEQHTTDYVHERDKLNAYVRELEDEMERIKRQYIARIRLGVDRTSQRYQALASLIEANKELFDSPRSYTFSGCKVGYRNLSGKTIVEDAETTIRLIKKKLPEQADLLIKVEEKIISKALGNLSTAELKSVACKTTDASDELVIKPVDSALDKYVDALLKEAQIIETAEARAEARAEAEA